MSEETFRFVENDPGQGSFSMTITEGKDSTEYVVPAIDFGFNKRLEEQYIKEQLKTHPVVAFRLGSRGMCHVEINPELLENPTVTRHYYKTFGNVLIEDPERPTDFHMVSPTHKDPPERIEIKAKTLSGLPFAATVSFVPTLGPLR